MQKVVFADLDNGMRVYSFCDRQSNLSGVGVKHGSIHNPPHKRGRSHGAEHAITCYSSRYDERQANLLMLKYCGDPDEDWKIETERTSTFYGHGVLLYKQHMLKIFDLMASFVRDQMFDLATFESEMAAVHQEYCLRGVDNLEDTLDCLVHETMYEHNPARQRIDCDLEDLKKFTPRDIRKCLRAYVPNNMFTIFLGPSLEEAKGLARHYFDKWEPGRIPQFHYAGDENVPVLKEIKRPVILRAGIHQHHVAIAFPTETFLSKDAEALDIFAKILKNRLYGPLRAKNRSINKGAYRVPVVTERTLIHGMLSISFATVCKEFADAGHDFVINEIKKMSQDLVAPDEFDAAWHNAKFAYLDAFLRTPNNLADLIIETATNGDENLVSLDYQNFCSRLHRVTREKVRTVVNKYFMGNYVHARIVPA